ncbi:hypothetical protein AMECASPLE_020902 [Ameca splendens]|uniref:Uncharacterized protein n=1 Tax=Ameca splendens TaxID=208324 RepID=A0ABV0YEI4_9TELE
MRSHALVPMLFLHNSTAFLQKDTINCTKWTTEPRRWPGGSSSRRMKPRLYLARILRSCLLHCWSSTPPDQFLYSCLDISDLASGFQILETPLVQPSSPPSSSPSTLLA